MTKLTMLVAAIATAALSACGSSNTPEPGSGGGAGGLSFPEAPGSGNGAVLASELAGLAANVAAVEAAIDDDSLETPAIAPSGQAVMRGYLSLSGGEDGDREVIGNMTIAANFDTGTVAASADGFRTFDFANEAAPTLVTGAAGVTGGSLAGSGTITGSSLTSTLDGTIFTGGDNVVIDGVLNGGIYDNGGTLMSVGSLGGTVESGGTVRPIEDEGDYIVSE